MGSSDIWNSPINNWLKFIEMLDNSIKFRYHILVSLLWLGLISTENSIGMFFRFEVVKNLVSLYDFFNKWDVC